MINTRDEYFMDKKLNVSEVSIDTAYPTTTNSYSTTDIPYPTNSYLTKTDDLELLNSALRCLF